MKIPGIITTGAVNLLSGLSNNKDSIIPMAFKDVLSDCVTVATYKKKGGSDDPREKAIEEFGTGAFWLFGIPTIKGIIDKTLYRVFKLNPNFDLRLMKEEDVFNLSLNSAKELAQQGNTAAQGELKVLSTLKDNNPIIKSLTNEQLYKGLFHLKFITATAATGLILSKIIRYKQKTTKDRIQNDIDNNKNKQQAQSDTLKNNVENSQIYRQFTSKLNKPSNTPSFKGIGEFFMYNPIANTSLMDCVITGTRLKEARHGERKEVALKEGFQIFFVYMVARPLQLMFEAIGNKLNLPIGLDPKILFSKDVKQEVSNAYKAAKENGLYDIKGTTLIQKLHEIAKQDINNPLIKMLSENGTIEIIKDKNTQHKALSTLNYLDSAELKSAIKNIGDLNQHISNLSKIRTYKTLSIIANLAIGITATGAIEPLTAIWMRKTLNHGDNRNPAIVEQEAKMNAQANMA